MNGMAISYLINIIAPVSILLWWLSNWLTGKKEFDRIKQSVILELQLNIEVTQQILNSVQVHGTIIPLLKDDSWHLILTSGQLKKFGGDRVEDPIYALGSIYRKIAIINQTILARQMLTFSTVRAMGDLYKQSLFQLEEFIRSNTTMVSSSIKKTEENLQKKDIIKAFRTIK